MPPQHSKRVHGLLRELAEKAYEAELRRELARLGEQFAKWNAGRISS